MIITDFSTLFEVLLFTCIEKTAPRVLQTVIFVLKAGLIFQVRDGKTKQTGFLQLVKSKACK